MDRKQLLGLAVAVMVVALSACATSSGSNINTGPNTIAGSNVTVTDDMRDQLAKAAEAAGDEATARVLMRGRRQAPATPRATPDADPIAQAALLMDEGQPAQGMALAQTALASHPDDPVLAVRVGGLMIKGGQLARASEIFRDTLARHPETVDAWNGLAIVLAQEGNLPDAADSLRRGLAVNPNDASLRYNLALVMLLSGEPEVSISMLTALDQTDPSQQINETLGLARAQYAQQQAAAAAAAARSAPATAAPHAAPVFTAPLSAPPATTP